MQGMERRHYARNRRNDQSREYFFVVELQNIADKSKSFNPEMKDAETARKIEKLHQKNSAESLVTDLNINGWEHLRHNTYDKHNDIDVDRLGRRSSFFTFGIGTEY